MLTRHAIRGVGRRHQEGYGGWRNILTTVRTQSRAAGSLPVRDLSKWLTTIRRELKPKEEVILG